MQTFEQGDRGEERALTPPRPRPLPPPFLQARRRRLNNGGQLSSTTAPHTTTMLDLSNDVVVSIFELVQQGPRWNSRVSPRRFVRETFPRVCRSWNALYRTTNASPLTDTLELDFKDLRVVRCGRYCSIRSRRLDAYVERHAVDIKKLSLKFGFLLDHHHAFERSDLAAVVTRLAPLLREVSMLHSDQELPLVLGSLTAGGEGATASSSSSSSSSSPSSSFADELRSFKVETIARIPQGHFQDLRKLLSLETLILTCPDPSTPDYGLSRAPLPIFALTRLTRLELNNNAAIDHVPPEISSLRNLRVLNLSCCGLRSLPGELGQLSSLTRIDLARNRWLGLTEDEDNAGWATDDDDGDGDTAFADDDDEEQKFPSAALCGLSSLAHVDLRFCNLRYLPSFVTSLTALESLYLSGNRFKRRVEATHHGFPPRFPRTLSRLTHLDLEYCGLSFIPRALVSSKMSAVRELNLRSNELTELPEDLGRKLRSLRVIDLSFNDFDPEGEREAREAVAGARDGATPVRIIGFGVDRGPLPGTLPYPPELPRPESEPDSDEEHDPVARFYNEVAESESEAVAEEEEVFEVDPRYDSAPAVLERACSPRGGDATKLVVAKGAGCAADVLDFTSVSLGALIEILGPRLTEITVGNGFESLMGPPFWASLRDVVAPAGKLRSLRLCINIKTSVSDVEFLRNLSSSLTELELVVCEAIRCWQGFAALSSFPEALLSLAELRSLKLDGCLLGSAALPSGVSSLRNLEQLTVRDCFLRSLPAELGTLTRLTSLDVSRSLHSEEAPEEEEEAAFPEALGGMTSLRVIKLDRWELHYVPSFVGALTRLESLSLRSNPLGEEATTPHFPELPSLASLDLAESYLSSVPPAVLSMTTLTDLDLSENELTDLPDDFGARLSRLKSINLHWNELSAVPQRALAGATALEKLDLSNNHERLQVNESLDFLLEALPKLRYVDLVKEEEVYYCGGDGDGEEEFPWSEKSRENINDFKLKMWRRGPSAKVLF